MPTGQTLTFPATSQDSSSTAGSVMFIGTATVLVRFGGLTFLTDPNFLHKGEAVHLGYGLTSTRRTNPAIEMSQLPPLDFVLLSHFHEDHFDREVEQRLDRSIPIITNVYAAAALRRRGFSAARALRTWESFEITKGDVSLRISSMPGKHAPQPLRLMLPSVMGSMLEFRNHAVQTRFRLYITGDTLVYDGLNEIRQRYPAIDLALLHLGGTRIFGIKLTMNGDDGVEAMKIVAPRRAIPLHYDDYPVFKSPLENFRRAVHAAGLDHAVTYVAPGATFELDVNR